MAAIGQTRAAFPAPAPQSKMRTPLFIFGVALALVAFLVMFAFGIVFVNRSLPTGTVPVVVAKANIDARTPITPDMLTLSSIPASAVPAHSYLHVADLKGMSAVVTIYKGVPISDNLVSSNPDQLTSGQSPYLPIPQGFVAITLPTGEQQGVAGYIAQGDYINVIATLDMGQVSPSKHGTVTHTVFTNVYVLRVGPESPVAKPAQGLTSSITVVMSLCDAQFMAWLIPNATLKYALLAYKDYQPSLPKADPACPSTSEPVQVGAAEVDARWHLTRG